MIFIDLLCGRSVYVDEFVYERTYAGLLEGSLTVDYNSEILEDAVERAQRRWRNDWPVYLVLPIVDTTDPEHPELPPVLCSTFLTDTEPVDESFMGSALVVVWLCNECKDTPLSLIIKSGVHDIPWEQQAKDFDW